VGAAIAGVVPMAPSRMMSKHAENVLVMTSLPSWLREASVAGTDDAVHLFANLDRHGDPWRRFAQAARCQSGWLVIGGPEPSHSSPPPAASRWQSQTFCKPAEAPVRKPVHRRSLRGTRHEASRLDTTRWSRMCLRWLRRSSGQLRLDGNTQDNSRITCWIRSSPRRREHAGGSIERPS
jgi:hypothetical protein